MSKTCVISVENPETIIQAQKAIKEKYGNDFFSQMADELDEPWFGPAVWRAIIDTEYPLDCLGEVDDYWFDDEDTPFWDLVKNKRFEEIYFTIDAVIDIYLHILNKFGAKISLISKEIPLANYLYGIETCGYGCFSD